MPQTRETQAQTPVNADTFNLTGDLATMGSSLAVIVTVASQSAGDTVATNRAAAGFAVTDARPLFIYNQTTRTIQVKDSSGWRDLNSPLGLVYQQVVTSPASATSDAIIGDISSFTFYAGRRYRIVWDLSYQQDTSGALFACSINTCAVADATSLLTGLTNLGQRTKGTFTAGVNVVTNSGPVQARYNPGTTVTVQVKFRCTRIFGSGNMTVSGSANEPAVYEIYDDGAAI